jgi:bacterioferritin-associated ferredoxin
MTKFKDLFQNESHNRAVEFPSVSMTADQHTLTLRFDSKDILLHAGYKGAPSPWLSSLCYLIEGKPLNELLNFSWTSWDTAFRDDQSYWDFRQDEEDKFIHKALELLKATLDVYRGRDYLYEEASPLVCRCFGIRESDILEHLQKEETPTLETLAGVSKAGMGCRSCVPQLKRWLVLHETKKQNHFYKEKPNADWLIEIDYMLSCFPKSQEWKMEVKSFKGKNVTITFDKDVTQKEEEATAKELQDFLGASVDGDLGFFLIRPRHLSKARG